MDSKKNLIIVLGPTSVGKSQTAIKLAETFNGEIINCDSMQVYKGFDIGTDKVSLENRGKLPHHLLDIIDPPTQFTAADFVRLALEAKVRSIAFPGISTGVYGYPKREAAKIALSVMRTFDDRFERIVACCFSEEDKKLYLEL